MEIDHAMDAFCLQDWVTISGGVGPSGFSATSIVQPAGGWLDLCAYQDVTFFLDVKEVAASTTVAYQTSPSCEESAFINMTSIFNVSVGTRADPIIAVRSPVALARYVRWSVSNGEFLSFPWGITFRIWAAAYRLP